MTEGYGTYVPAPLKPEPRYVCAVPPRPDLSTPELREAYRANRRNLSEARMHAVLNVFGFMYPETQRGRWNFRDTADRLRSAQRAENPISGARWFEQCEDPDRVFWTEERVRFSNEAHRSVQRYHRAVRQARKKRRGWA